MGRAILISFPSSPGKVTSTSRRTEPSSHWCQTALWLALAMSLVAFAPWLSAQTSAPSVFAVMNAAAATTAPALPIAVRGSLVKIVGSNLAGATANANSYPLPTSLAGTQVTFAGIRAPLQYVSPTQISAQVPFEIPDPSAADVVVQNANGTSQSFALTLVAQDPDIFVALRSGSIIGPANPVAAGDAITIYATGLGAVSPAVVSGQPGPSTPQANAVIAPVVKLGGRQLNIDFAGLAPGQLTYVINATAPTDLAAPTSELTVEPGGTGAKYGSAQPAQPPMSWQGRMERRRHLRPRTQSSSTTVRATSRYKQARIIHRISALSFGICSPKWAQPGLQERPDGQG